eukprot:TRINITY_DN49_c0_g1_i8.p1 TRINITY_DN49_c0_g1~~TRINITY_DN49_c0_g1_i8.p1  ORF type:complete len:332 (+),score=84.28 TRINITY_DN49_c0_g1_i8:88-1083(+)
MKTAFLLAMCVSLATAEKSLFVLPSLYTSNDCTGNTDPAPALWSYLAKDGISVKPFQDSGYSAYTINQCMTDDSVTYSVMLTIDSTACPGNGTESLQLSYWRSTSKCEGAPTSVTTLSANTCVPTPLGSAKFSPSLTTTELCVLMTYRTAMETGGMRRRVWKNSQCNGATTSNMLTTMASGSCSAPMCTGCCKARNPTTCKWTESDYELRMATCKKAADKWANFEVVVSYSNDVCSSRSDSNPASGLAERVEYCNTVTEEGPSTNTSVSVETNFVAPLTIDIYCQWVQLNTKYNVDGFLSWDEFNKRVNGAPAAHPVSVLALVVLLVTVLF